MAANTPRKECEEISVDGIPSDRCANCAKTFQGTMGRHRRNIFGTDTGLSSAGYSIKQAVEMALYSNKRLSFTQACMRNIAASARRQLLFHQDAPSTGEHVDLVPQYIREGTKEKQRSWLYEKVGEIVDACIMNSETAHMGDLFVGVEGALQRRPRVLHPCREPDCTRQFRSSLKGLGPNLTEQTASRISKSLGILKCVLGTTDEELGVAKPSGYHHSANKTGPSRQWRAHDNSYNVRNFTHTPFDHHPPISKATPVPLHLFFGIWVTFRHVDHHDRHWADRCMGIEGGTHTGTQLPHLYRCAFHHPTSPFKLIFLAKTMSMLKWEMESSTRETRGTTFANRPGYGIAAIFRRCPTNCTRAVISARQRTSFEHLGLSESWGTLMGFMENEALLTGTACINEEFAKEFNIPLERSITKCLSFDENRVDFDISLARKRYEFNQSIEQHRVDQTVLLSNIANDPIQVLRDGEVTWEKDMNGKTAVDQLSKDELVKDLSWMYMKQELQSTDVQEEIVYVKVLENFRPVIKSVALKPLQKADAESITRELVEVMEQDLRDKLCAAGWMGLMNVTDTLHTLYKFYQSAQPVWPQGNRRWKKMVVMASTCITTDARHAHRKNSYRSHILALGYKRM
ncbi:Serine palmitoyltransferase 2 [Branchiostoma belcheri]|nr:Serine palmitoyltransferase 2 [Branchiostoma belcheri]